MIIETIVALFFGTIAALMLLATITIISKTFLHICEPHQVLIISGRQRTMADGSTVGYRVVFGGRAWRTPIIERVESMDVRNIPIDIRVAGAYSKGGIPLSVHAIANVRIAKDPRIIGNAIERFLGRDPLEIQKVAKETLEGHLRGVLATLTPEEINEDRLKFAQALMEEAGDDFHRLGLYLDTLKIQAVSDEVNYLNSIGRSRIAVVLRDAQMAESTNLSDAEQVEARARREAEVAVARAETVILETENGVSASKAELEATAKSEEERMTQAAARARAEAEQELQQIRAELERLRLINDVVLPAQAAQQADALRARGRAAYLEENGRANAEVLKMMTEAWVRAGKDAKDIFLIQNLEKVLASVVERVKAVQVGEVVLMDGGDGRALPSYAASYPAMVGSVLKELKSSTGVDVVGILSQSATKEGEK